MRLSDELALRCLLTKRAQEDGLSPMREEFEDLAAKERVARGQAARFSDIAKDRASDEAEKTPLDTFTDRLYPVPHTMGEAAWRVPAAIAGGVAGHQFVANRELPPLESLRELLRPDMEHGAGGSTFAPSEVGKRLAERLHALGHTTADDAALAAEKIMFKEPEHIGAAIGMRPEMLLGEKPTAMRKALDAAIGKPNDRSAASIIREVLHDAGSGEKSKMGTGMSKWKRFGGAGAGVAAAVLATGIPLGLRALWKRREGGEAASRAKGRVSEELSKAESASKRREEILQQLGTQA